MVTDFCSFAEMAPIWQALLAGIALHLTQKLVDLALSHTWYTRTEKAVEMLRAVQEIKDDSRSSDIELLKNSIYRRIEEKNKIIEWASNLIESAPFLTIYILSLIATGVQTVINGSLSQVRPWMIAFLAFLCFPVLIIDVLFQKFVLFLREKIIKLSSTHWEKKRGKQNKKNEMQMKEIVDGAKLVLVSLEEKLEDANLNRKRCIELSSRLELNPGDCLDSDTRFECIEVLAGIKEDVLRVESIRVQAENQISRCDMLIEINKDDASRSTYLKKVIEAKLLFSEQLKVIDRIEDASSSTIEVYEKRLGIASRAQA